VVSLRALKSMHILRLPSFFDTKSNGAPYGDQLGSISPLLSASCTCFMHSSPLHALTCEKALWMKGWTPAAAWSRGLPLPLLVGTHQPAQRHPSTKFFTTPESNFLPGLRPCLHESCPGLCQTDPFARAWKEKKRTRKEKTPLVVMTQPAWLREGVT